MLRERVGPKRSPYSDRKKVRRGCQRKSKLVEAFSDEHQKQIKTRRFLLLSTFLFISPSIKTLYTLETKQTFMSFSSDRSIPFLYSYVFSFTLLNSNLFIYFTGFTYSFNNPYFMNIFSSSFIAFTHLFHACICRFLYLSFSRLKKKHYSI